jgi:lipopolysaccharide/colanic/teichoic acid biosynthesis glycosyltransferase
MFGGTVVKRGVDVAISAVLLLLALPILLLSALIIRITSPGPVLFRQDRMGRGFQTFQICKLRTMAHAEAGLAYTLGPDPRITPFGKWLRRTKFDELPQLWNVLRGDMSLVGSRPVIPELTSEFRVHYQLLLRQRPGLTDPASLKYSQEARLLATAPDPLRFFKTVVTPDKIRISTEYMERANLWTDAATLMMTAAICCFPSLGRLYGSMPDAALCPPAINPRPSPEISPARGLPPAPALAVARSTTTESLFHHELAILEAAAEEDRHLAVVPWILLQIPGLQPQSTPSSLDGGVS